jgi:hypothetical protein
MCSQNAANAISGAQISKIFRGGMPPYHPRILVPSARAPPKFHEVSATAPRTEEISAVWRGRGEKIVSDNSKCIRTSKWVGGINFQFPPWGWYGCFLE